MFVPRNDLKALTGYTRTSAQVRWLRARNARFVINAKGQLVVAVEEAERLLIDPPYVPLPKRLLSERGLRLLPQCSGVRFHNSGVYFLWSADELVYIGQSGFVPDRVERHWNKKWDRYTFIECGNDYARADLEAAYIRRYPTKYNRQTR